MFPEMGRMGAATGAVAGHGLGSLLDAPRAAATNLFISPFAHDAVRQSQGAQDEDDHFNRVTSMLPGLAGMLAGGASAFVPGLLPFAGLIGSGVAGLGQYLGEALAPEGSMHAPSTDDLVRTAGGNPDELPGQLASFGLGIATDPFTWAGALGGHGAGAAADSYLTDVARTRGPQYAGGVEKLEGLRPQIIAAAERGGYEPTRDLAKLDAMLASPEVDRLLGEIPPKSRFLGSGMEAMAVQSGENNAIRIGGGPEAWDVRRKIYHEGESLPAPDPRVNIPEMLQPARSVPIGQHRVEHLPLLDALETGLDPLAEATLHGELKTAIRGLDQSASARGFEVPDLHVKNAGRTAEGRYVILDPGAVGGVGPEQFTQRPGGPVSHTLLDMLGADSRVQGQLEEGLRAGAGSSGLSAAEIEGLTGRNPVPPATERVLGAPPRPAMAPSEQERLQQLVAGGPQNFRAAFGMGGSPVPANLPLPTERTLGGLPRPALVQDAALEQERLRQLLAAGPQNFRAHLGLRDRLPNSGLAGAL